VGALARAKYTIENYDGAPAVREALQIMARCYRELDMQELAAHADSVYKENFSTPEEHAEQKRHWWRFW
jgi:outer membrane protein assembly factor BamD